MLQLYLIHFNDEAPLIGAGWRLIWAKSGRIWTHMLYAPKAATVRIKRSTFEDMRATEVPPSPRLRRVLRRFIRYAGRDPTKLERMALSRKDER